MKMMIKMPLDQSTSLSTVKKFSMYVLFGFIMMVY